QSGGYSSPLRRSETLDLSPEDAEKYGLTEGQHVRVTSRRGTVIAPVRTDSGLRPGLAFMTLHFPDDVAVNLLTIDATDPKSGTAEFKATAIRIDTLSPEELAAHLAAQAAGNGRGGNGAGGNGRSARAGESVAPGAS